MNPKIQELIDKFKALDPKKQMYALIGVVAFVLILDYFILIRMQLAGIGKISAPVKELSQNLERVKNNIAQLDKTKQEVDRLKTRLDEANLKIRPRHEVPILLEDISRIANTYGVKIDQLMPVKEDEEKLVTNNDKVYYALPILIQARSGYHGLGKFLYQMEAENLFFNIESLLVGTNDKDTNFHLVQLTIKTLITEEVDPNAPTDDAQK